MGTGLQAEVATRTGRVEVVELEYVKFRDTAPPRLFSLYESYWRTLRGFGLATFRDAVEPAEQKGKRVLTERDVLGAYGSGVPRIEVTASCRVTPLARERAGRLGVEIIRQTGGRG